MKRFSLFFGSVFVFSLFFAACVQDGTDTPAEPPRDPHKVPVAQALADLDGLLCEIDGRIEQKRALADPSGTGYTEEWRTLYHCNYGYDGDSDGYYYSEVFDLKKGAEIIDKENGDVDTDGDYIFSASHRIITCAGFTI